MTCRVATQLKRNSDKLRYFSCTKIFKNTIIMTNIQLFVVHRHILNIILYMSIWVHCLKFGISENDLSKIRFYYMSLRLTDTNNIDLNFLITQKSFPSQLLTAMLCRFRIEPSDWSEVDQGVTGLACLLWTEVVPCICVAGIQDHKPNQRSLVNINCNDNNKCISRPNRNKQDETNNL